MPYGCDVECQSHQCIVNANSATCRTVEYVCTSTKILQLEKDILKRRVRYLEEEVERLNNSSNSTTFKDSLENEDDVKKGANNYSASSFLDSLRDRGKWLVALLFFQSCSGIILARNEMLLKQHPIIVYFLTMLVGAGGNAGNQASVRVIRSLALGTLSSKTLTKFLSRELAMAFTLSMIMSSAGFIRAVLFLTPLPETIAITTALSLIVFSSICFGVLLPLLLNYLKIDPAHSSTAIQVLMDILGVYVTVCVTSFVLDIR